MSPAFCPALAENMPDPTKPPARFAAPTDDAASGPVLQSVLISPNRRIAIISGKTVKIGDKFGDAVVASIQDNRVVLRSGSNQEVLTLYPPLRKPDSKSRSGSDRDIPGQQR